MRNARMLIALLYVISASVHAYVGLRTLPHLQAPSIILWALVTLLVASSWLVPAALIGNRKPHPRWSAWIAWCGFVCMGLLSSLLVLTLLRDITLGALWLVEAASDTSFLHQNERTTSAIAVWIGAFAITAVGFINARRAAAVKTVHVPIRGLPESLDGFTIAQITDIHVGPTIGRDYLLAIVARVNSLDADMVAITGDLVDGRVHRLAHHVEPLRDLRARHGTFFVTGNHEYYSGAHSWVEHLQTLGLRVLMNEHVLLPHDEHAVLVAGVTDYSAHLFDEAHRSDAHAAIADAPDHAAVRILLAHQPRSIFKARGAGYHLQLSGHTHGGQFLPWNWLVPLQQPFTAGLHWHEELWIYISRGTGYWGPPKRFGAPAEITRLVLTPDNR